MVFALPHSGNWDAAGVWLVDCARRARSLTVAERLEPESLYRRFVELPRGAGHARSCR